MSDQKTVSSVKVLVPQVRILKALAKAKGPMNKALIQEKAAIPQTWVAEYIGTENMVADEVRGAKKLIPAGYVKLVYLDVDGLKEKAYVLTASGRKFVEKLDKANGKPEKAPKASQNGKVKDKAPAQIKAS